MRTPLLPSLKRQPTCSVLAANNSLPSISPSLFPFCAKVGRIRIISMFACARPVTGHRFFCGAVYPIDSARRHPACRSKRRRQGEKGARENEMTAGSMHAIMKPQLFHSPYNERDQRRQNEGPGIGHECLLLPTPMIMSSPRVGWQFGQGRCCRRWDHAQSGSLSLVCVFHATRNKTCV